MLKYISLILDTGMHSRALSQPGRRCGTRSVSPDYSILEKDTTSEPWPELKFRVPIERNSAV